MRGRLLLIVCVAADLVASCAIADWMDFAPRPLENGAFLDAYTSYERDKINNGRSSSRWTDTFIREKLTLFSDGYSYHPRFLQYRFSISGLLRQEDFESSVIETPGWRNDTGLEYDVRLFFLPEHPYNLNLYAARFEPLFKEQAAVEHGAIETTRGASFRYRKKPYFLHTGYGDEHIDSGLTSSDVTRFFLEGEYFKRFTSGNELSFTGAFNPSWFSATGGIDGSNFQYLLGNFVNLQRVRLNSNLSKLEFDQEGGASQRLTTDQLEWDERLTAYLPWNFRGDLRYLYQNNDATIDEPGTASDRDLSATNNDLQLDVTHRLYESLDSTYTFLDSWRDSFGGKTSFLSNGLTFNYTKIIPWGRVMAGTNLARGDTDSSGEATSVVGEEHQAVPVPGSFTLRQQNIDATSVVVFLKSSLPPPCGLIQLKENVNYALIPVGNTFEVQVSNLDLLDSCQFVVPGTFDFTVSYSLTGGNFDLRTDTIGSSASAQLFDDLLTPYFSYVNVSSTVLSGEFPGVPLDSTTYTAGLILHRGPLRARGEYQDFQWEAAPRTSWLAEVQYASALNESTSVYAAASYLDAHYSQGTIVLYQNVTDYTERTVTGSGNIQKQLFSRNMFLSAGGSYSRINGLVDTNAYAANASFIWRVGKMEIAIGANVYGSDSSGTQTLSTTRDHELVYMKLRRRLF